MDLGLGNSLMAGDPRLIDHIVGEVKSQGIFDKFRKECLADVDTKPAYQNLRTRVESSVNSFLNKQTWRTDLNKNQLRETLRKHIHDAPYLEVGVERIVDQVVNPKIYSIFMPQIEDVVYKFLGIERPKSQRNGACDLKDLLPKDLDPVSPESDRNSLKDISLESVDENASEPVNGNEQKPSSSTAEIKMEVIEEAFIKKEESSFENGDTIQLPVASPIKAVLNNSFKSDDTNKMEEEEEESPDFEPIDNLNESNMSNDSHLSGISELTSHRSQSPDFMTEFSRDNFDCSNQDSQLSKVSSNSRLSIVTDFGSSNHASTPIPEPKDDSKNTKDNFKAISELDNAKESKFDFEVIKNKNGSKASNSSKENSSKENSRDATDYKESKVKDESKSKSSKDKYESKSSKDKDRDSKRRHSSKSKYFSNKSKDKSESEFQESKENTSKYKENKVKDTDKKDDSSKEVKDLKDLYKEKIRELREKKELTEKEKLGKDVRDVAKVNDSKDKKDALSRERDDKKTHKSSSSSSRSSSYHSSSKSKNSESKDSKEKRSSRREDRRHSNGKSDSKTSKRKRESRSNSRSERSRDRSLKDKKRREEKKSKSIDDHSSLRKSSNDRRSTDRDGSNGSSSKYSHKSSNGAGTSGKLGLSTNLKVNKDHHSSGEASDSVHDSLQMMFEGNEYAKGYTSDNPPKRVDPGSVEICLPLKKRPLHSDDSVNENDTKKSKLEEKKANKKVEKDIFKSDSDVTNVPDEERVQIIEIPDEEYEQPYPDEETILSIEETKKIILDTESTDSSKLTEMEQSIRDSLNEMLSEHNKMMENEADTASNEAVSIIDPTTTTLIETLTGDDEHKELKSPLPVTNSDTEFTEIKNENEQTEKDSKEDIKGVLIEKVEKKENADILADSVINNKIVEKEKVILDIKTEIKEEIDSEVKTEPDTINVEKNTTEKSNIDYAEKMEYDIEENIENISKEIKDNVETTEINIEDRESSEINVKLNEESTEKDSKNINKLNNQETKENSKGAFDQDQESIGDNADEFNEDDKLVIDEEFRRKESEDEDTSLQVKKATVSHEKIDDYQVNKNDIELPENKKDAVELDENSESGDAFEEQIHKQESIEEDKISDDVFISENDEKSNDENISKNVIGDNYEISKVNENHKNINKTESDKLCADSEKKGERNEISEMSIETVGNDAEISTKDEVIEKSSEVKETSSDTQTDEKLVKDEDSEITKKIAIQFESLKDKEMESTINEADDKVESLDNDDNDVDDEEKCSKLIIDCKEKEEEELSPAFQEDSTQSDEISSSDSSSIPSKASKKLQIEQPSTSKVISTKLVEKNRQDLVASPIEEDCYYLESDNQRYLAFKKYLEKLEADPRRTLEDMIESFGGVVIPAKVLKPTVLQPRPAKRKSLSPIAEVLDTNSNNNNDGLTKETNIETASENVVINVVKKRKVGRAKKASSTIVRAPTPKQQQAEVEQQPEIQEQPEIQQQQLPPQQQQPPTPINGENFVMPPSPESDASAVSDKSSASALKDERSRQRNNQRYSSDDLYKPRPLFSSSSRRNRRFHQS